MEEYPRFDFAIGFRENRDGSLTTIYSAHSAPKPTKTQKPINKIQEAVPNKLELILRKIKEA